MSFLKMGSNWLENGHAYWIGHRLVSVSDIPPVCHPFPRVPNDVLQAVVILGRECSHLYEHRTGRSEIVSVLAKYEVVYHGTR